MPYDNAVMESFFRSSRIMMRFVDQDEARSKMFDYIEVFYNRERLHSGLDYRSPAQFEQMAVVS